MTSIKLTCWQLVKPCTFTLFSPVSSAVFASFVCAFTLSTSFSASAAVYKSLDSEGNIIFTDRPKEGATVVKQKSPVVISGLPKTDKNTQDPNEQETPNSDTPVDQQISDTQSNANTDQSSNNGDAINLSSDASLDVQNNSESDTKPVRKLPHVSELDLDELTDEELDLLTDYELEVLVKRKEAKDEAERNKVVEEVYEFDKDSGLGKTVMHTPDPDDLPKDNIKAITQANSEPITFVEITSPAHEATMRDPNGKIWVQLKTHPKPLKQSDLRAELWLNGRLVAKGKRSMLGLPTPNRGTHELQIKLVDSNGEVKLKSAPSLIHVKRFIDGR